MPEGFVGMWSPASAPDPPARVHSGGPGHEGNGLPAGLRSAGGSTVEELGAPVLQALHSFRDPSTAALGAAAVSGHLPPADPSPPPCCPAIQADGNIKLIDNESCLQHMWKNCGFDSILVPTTQKWVCEVQSAA